MSLKQMLGASLDAVLEDAEVRGEGEHRLPGCPVPPVTKEDMARDPVDDYCFEMTEPDQYDLVTRAWIRRAVHAEAFAKAVETELEALRHGR